MDLIVGSILIILKLILIILLLLLLRIYISNYKSIKIGYTLGLMFFTLMMLVKNLATLGFMFAHFDMLAFSVNPQIYFETIFELVAIAALYKITKDF